MIWCLRRECIEKRGHDRYIDLEVIRDIGLNIE
jgi:hypothetical protein